MTEPYCGPAPYPADWLYRWNLDVNLLIVLAGAASLHFFFLSREAVDVRARRYVMAATAWASLVLLFVSPLCALTSALFSVRVAHHAVLVAIVAPLFVSSLPERWRMGQFCNVAAWGTVAFVGHMVILWVWHAPAPYAAALNDTRLFWLMELSLLFSAMLLWGAALSRSASIGGSLGILLGSVVQMGLLGAAITFARAPLYATHLSVTEPFGLSAIEDQQLAGLLMWVPASIPYLASALALLADRMRSAVADEAVQ